MIDCINYGGTSLHISKTYCFILGTKAIVSRAKQTPVPRLFSLLIYTKKLVCESKKFVVCIEVSLV